MHTRDQLLVDVDRSNKSSTMTKFKKIEDEILVKLYVVKHIRIYK